MMSLVPDMASAHFPDCGDRLVVFDPTLTQLDRIKLLSATAQTEVSKHDDH
jgi:hypothetical protein